LLAAGRLAETWDMCRTTDAQFATPSAIYAVAKNQGEEKSSPWAELVPTLLLKRLLGAVGECSDEELAVRGHIEAFGELRGRRDDERASLALH